MLYLIHLVKRGFLRTYWVHTGDLICLMHLRLHCALQDINRFDLYSNPEEGGMTNDPILQLRKLRA